MWLIDRYKRVCYHKRKAKKGKEGTSEVVLDTEEWFKQRSGEALVSRRDFKVFE